NGQYALLRAARQQHGLEGVEDDVGIERHGHVLDVVEVVFQLGDGVLEGVAVLVVDLRPAGDAGAHAVALAVIGNLFAEGFDELGALGAGADDGHLAFEDVEELGQLVEADGAKKAADFGDAGIVLLCPYGAGGEFGVDAHGTELVHGEERAIETDAGLAVEHGSGGGEADGEGGEQNKRGAEDNGDDGHEHIRNPLVEQVLTAWPQLAGEDELGGADFPEADALVGIGGFFDDVSGEAEFEQFADRHAAAPLEHADHDAMGLDGVNDIAQRFHWAQDLAARECGAGLLVVIQIAGDLQAAFGVIGDVLADVFEQRTAAHQQEAIAAHQ